MTDKYLWKCKFVNECEKLKLENVITDEVFQRLTNIVIETNPIKKRGRKQMYFNDDERKNANRANARKYYFKQKAKKLKLKNESEVSEVSEV